MNRILTIVFVSFLKFYVFSQVVFSPPGAEWNYLFNPLVGGPGQKVNEKMKYVRDTVIDSKTVKILEHKRFFTRYNFQNYGPTYLWQNGDTVFFRNGATYNTWQILYNFAALPQHTWTNSIACGAGNFTVRIISVSTVTINNMPLKAIEADYINAASPNTFQKVLFYERIGGSYFLFNYTYGKCAQHGDLYLDFLCYKDSTFGVKQFSEYPCDFTDLVGVSEADFVEGNVQVFPNPATVKLNLIHPAGTIDGLNYEIRNVWGQKMDLNCGADNESINVSLFPGGIYFISVNSGNGRSVTKFIVDR